MSAKIYYGTRLWGEFGLRTGPGSQTVTLCLQQENTTEVRELITFSVANDRLIFTSAILRDRLEVAPRKDVDEK